MNLIWIKLLSINNNNNNKTLPREVNNYFSTLWPIFENNNNYRFLILFYLFVFKCYRRGINKIKLLIYLDVCVQKKIKIVHFIVKILNNNNEGAFSILIISFE